MVAPTLVQIVPATPLLQIQVLSSPKTIFSQILKGSPGANGTDASVTSENIVSALGYTPADAAHFGTAASQNSTAFDAAGSASTDLATATTRAIAFSIAL